MRTGIVLAGGRSARFRGDKLSADLDGRTLLARAIDALARVTDRVLVAVSELQANVQAAGVPVGLVHDQEAYEGPLAALANVLGSVVDPDPVDDLAIVVGGDMPRLVPAVLRSMLDRLANDSGVEAVLLGRPPSAVDPNGKPPRRPVLPLAIRVRAAARVAVDAVDSGERSLQAFVDRLVVTELPFSTWSALDPGADTLLDVDTAADLERIRGR